jgi:hypothetical protein
LGGILFSLGFGVLEVVPRVGFGRGYKENDCLRQSVKRLGESVFGDFWGGAWPSRKQLRVFAGKMFLNHNVFQRNYRVSVS